MRRKNYSAKMQDWLGNWIRMSKLPQGHWLPNRHSLRGLLLAGNSNLGINMLPWMLVTSVAPKILGIWGKKGVDWHQLGEH